MEIRGAISFSILESSVLSYIALLIQVSVLFGAHMMRSFINSLSSSQRYLHEAGKQLVSKVVIISYHAYSQLTRLYCPVLECLAVHIDEHSAALCM